MSRLLLTIDQTPCRASYGLLGQEDLRRDTAATQRSVVRENVALVVDRGNRLGKITGASVATIAGEEYPSEPVPDIVLAPVERPVFSVREVSGIDIVI